MAIQHWSDDIIVAELSDDPQFTEEIGALIESLTAHNVSVVVNMSAVGYVNSSNISKLLRLRKQMINTGQRLLLCGVTNQVWGVFLVTGLDKIFEFTNDVATALATIQLARSGRGT